jgi:ketosteroid isomerase-like protein
VPTIETELRALVERYAAAIDRRDADAVRSLFIEEATFVVPEVPGSPSRTLHVQTELGNSLGVYLCTLHAIVGFVVHETSGGDATGTTACIAHHLRDRDGRLSNEVWGFRYHDRFRLEAGSWLFARRALVVDWIEARDVAHVRTPEGWLSS